MDRHIPASLELEKVLAYLASFTVSEAGEQAALAWTPFNSLAEIQQEGLLFEQGQLWAAHNEIRLSPFPSLDGVLHSVSSPHSILDLDALWALRQTLGQARFCVDMFMQSGENTPWPLWVKRCQEIALPKNCMAALARCLADDGHLKDEASPELSLVRGELRRLHQQCTRKVKEYAAEYNILHYLQDDFMTLSSDRYVLPLKSNFKGRLQGVIHDYSQTGETCYFEPLFLVEVNNRLQGLKREEREEERKIFLYLSELVRSELFAIRAVYSLLVDLDLLFARAALAACYDGRLVRMEPDADVFLNEARHPLLALSASQDAVRSHERFIRRRAVLSGEAELPGELPPVAAKKHQSVIPSTISLRRGQQALVISGGNAGGKTVCLKSLGLIALMVTCVLPVPVDAGSTLPEWRRIHAFIGDEQSLDDQVSTFTAQITHLARIWPQLDAHSLVILDEFGAGTDPSQGAALAQAVVDGIMEKKAYVVVATHFPALKAYALSTEKVRSASVIFDPGTKRPLFRLAYEQVGASQALDVAREHGLPESILKRAEQYLLVSGEDTTMLVDRLNSLAVEREQELLQLGREREAYREKKAKLEIKAAQERDTLFASVQKQAKDVLAAWQQGKATHKQTLKELAQVRAGLARQGALATDAVLPDGFPLPDLAALALGKQLTHIPWKRTGILVEVDCKKKRVRLDLDGVTLWAEAADVTDMPLAQVLSVLGQTGAGKNKGVLPATKPRPVPLGKENLPNKQAGSLESLPLHLDLRGLRADVAVSELEKFLDTAILRGRMTVEVVHGRGTGALRRELHIFLKSFAPVANFRLAPDDQGGDGKTIVELK